MLRPELHWKFLGLLLCSAAYVGGYSAGTALDAALGYASKHHVVYEKDLLQLVSIPSISSLHEHLPDVRKAAEWLKKRLKSAGMEGVEILETEGHPAVYAHWLRAPGRPTVLIYAHYDVQPVDPLELWRVAPFSPVVENGSVWGRGAQDDKGGVLITIHAVEAYLKSSGKLPVNVKFLLEGQEEIGSPHLPAFLEKEAARFAADVALSADGAQISIEQPGLVLGLRGAAAFQVDVQTLEGDVHSGGFGGSIQNPIHALAAFVEGLHYPNGSVAIPGFYRGVRAIEPEDKDDVAAFPHDEAQFLEELGASETAGEEGFHTLERIWLRPTCDAVGIHGGFAGEGIKTIVPARAFVKVACRLVPDQDPDYIINIAREFVESTRIPGAKLSFTPLGFRADPYVMPRDTLSNKAAAKVLEKVVGKKPPLFFRMGGSIPAMAYFKKYLDLDMTALGFGLPDDHVHAPNERFRLSQYHAGREAYIRISRRSGMRSWWTVYQTALRHTAPELRFLRMLKEQDPEVVDLTSSRAQSNYVVEHIFHAQDAQSRHSCKTST
eukprot:jgi/Botrbrau1/11019/Bobra.101_1s0017.1